MRPSVEKSMGVTARCAADPRKAATLKMKGGRRQGPFVKVLDVLGAPDAPRLSTARRGAA